MPKEKHLEIKVGIFVLVAAICLTGFIFSISDFSVLRKGSTFNAVFSFANGLKKSAPVRFAGVDAGLVKDITIYYDKQTKEARVNVEIWLENGHLVPSDSSVFINQLGLLGEKYLEIMPGTATTVVSENGTIRGDDPIAMDHITKTFSDVSGKVVKALDDLNNGLLSEKNLKSLESSLQGVDKLVTSINNGEGTIGKLMMDDAIFRNMEEMTADLKSNPWKLFYRPKASKKSKKK